MLEEIGLDSSIADIIANIPFELPTRLLNLTSLIIPSFDKLQLGAGFLAQLFGYSKEDDSNVDNGTIGGVGGLDSFNSSQNSTQSMNFGTINPGNLQFNNQNTPPVITPADSIVIPDVQNPAGTPQIQDEGNWFEELMADRNAVLIIVIILVLTFGICFTLFIMIFNEKSARDKLKKRRK